MTRIFAAIIGACGGFGLTSVLSMVFGYGRGAGSLRPLLARARTDGPIEDGESIVATGVLHIDRPLISPIGGTPCAAYDYRMARKPSGAGRETEHVPVYWGYAAQPFTVDSPGRRYAVAAAGPMSREATPATSADAMTRARHYVRSTRWETVEYRMLGALDTVRQRLEDNAPAGTRKDFAADSAAPIDVALLILEETALPIGATVSVFGTWSSTDGMIVAPPSPLPGSHVVVVEGGPDALKGQAGVPHSTTGYLTGAVVLLALAAGLFWVATVIIPTVRG